ncbi:MAG: sialidase family protein, partial [Bryobacteraceae bacterium]
MMHRLILCAVAVASLTASAAEPTRVVKNVTVFHQPGMFGGWPANNGVWVWGNEIVVGFIQGYFKNNERGHAIDGQKPELLRFARSTDGGLTWKIEAPSFLNADGKEDEGTECPGGLDFTAPNSAVALRMVSSSRGFSRFYYSKDRAKTWQGPYKLPAFDRKGIAARTDYIV